ncbi:hypothetical protein C8255_10670 [filamentous cyanobacterium CCP3]|nr:hypothetical protein C8255_10670 [filamentous cyanobacterium CCP3]
MAIQHYLSSYQVIFLKDLKLCASKHQVLFRKTFQTFMSFIQSFIDILMALALISIIGLLIVGSEMPHLSLKLSQALKFQP